MYVSEKNNNLFYEIGTFCLYALFLCAGKSGGKLRIMALDIGDKRVGVAVSDEYENIAQPLLVFNRAGNEKDLAQIRQLIEKNNVKYLIIGKPINMDGSVGARAKKTEQFYNYIRKRIDIDSEMFDERFTTVLAQQVLLEGDVSRAKRKQVVDKLAAQQILYTYLEKKKKGTDNGR